MPSLITSQDNTTNLFQINRIIHGNMLKSYIPANIAKLVGFTFTLIYDPAYSYSTASVQLAKL